MTYFLYTLLYVIIGVIVAAILGSAAVIDPKEEHSKAAAFYTLIWPVLLGWIAIAGAILFSDIVSSLMLPNLIIGSFRLSLVGCSVAA